LTLLLLLLLLLFHNVQQAVPLHVAIMAKFCN
jgi:hypothetical protein